MSDPDSVLDPGAPMISLLPSGGLRLEWPTPSPGWSLDKNPDLGPVWISAGTPQRVNGMWFINVDPPLDPKQFFRLVK
jgi:hypothetical protein